MPHICRSQWLREIFLYFLSVLLTARGVDPYGTGGHAPQYLWRGGRPLWCPPSDILAVMSFRLGLFYPVKPTIVVCCILMQILCVVSQKSFSFWGLRPPDLLPGLRLWTPLGDSILQTSSLLLCPPNNPVRSTPLQWTQMTRGQTRGQARYSLMHTTQWTQTTFTSC